MNVALKKDDIVYIEDFFFDLREYLRKDWLKDNEMIIERKYLKSKRKKNNCINLYKCLCNNMILDENDPTGLGLFSRCARNQACKATKSRPHTANSKKGSVS